MIGRTISHYHIIEKIGGGGMGVVYKAEDTKLKRTVALKFLPPAFSSDPEVKNRFIHEAQAASALDHPNICTIHEIGESEDGQSYIAMAYYAGMSLHSKIKDERLKIKDRLSGGVVSIDESIDIAIQIAKGLQKAHKKGIVHRDIKPANIMITEEGEVKILDFGLAKYKGQTRLTQDGSTLGTVAYMSPEQSRGEEVDQRSDIWSLGVILYEMLSGKVPFQGSYDQAIIYSILNEEPEPIEADISERLKQIIDKCLQKNLPDRYQQVDDLLTGLQGLNIESVLATPQEGKASTLPSPMKNFFTAAAIMLSIVLILVVGYFLFFPSEQAVEWESSIAVLPFTDLSPNNDQEYFCDGMTEQIITNLSKIGRLKVIGRTSMMTYKKTNKKLPDIGEELDVSHILEGSIRKEGKNIRVTAQLISAQDGSHLWAEDYDRQLEHVFEVQDDVSEAIAASLLSRLSGEEVKVIKTSRPRNTEAYEYYLKGDYFHFKKFLQSFKSEDFRTSERMFKKAIGLDSTYALSYAGLADLYHSNFQMGAKTEEERQYYLELLRKNIEKAYELDNSSAYVNRVRASYYSEQGDIQNAYNFYKKAYEIDKNSWDSNIELHGFYYRRGLYYIALKYDQRAILIDPLDPMSRTHRAYLYEDLGQFDQAELDYKKLLEMDPNHCPTQIRYAILLVYLKKYEWVKVYLEKFENNCSQFTMMANVVKFIKHIINGEREEALKIENPEKYYLLELSEEALNILNKSYEGCKILEKSKYLHYLHHPKYDFLREDPRFQEILAKHKELYDENMRKYGYVEEKL